MANRKKSYLFQAERGTKSASSPLAQSVTLLQRVNKYSATIKTMQRRIYALSEYPLSFRVLLHVMLHTGCRISEVLALEPWNISESGHVLIKANKGSNDRLVVIPKYEEKDYIVIKKAAMLFKNYSRFYVYRQMNKLGFILKKNGVGNNSVTHMFRHLYVNQIQAQFNDNELSRKALGHKGENSIKYYLDEKQE